MMDAPNFNEPIASKLASERKSTEQQDANLIIP